MSEEVVVQTVTIEGSLNPSVDLPRGERRTVGLTDYTIASIRQGHAVVVEPSETQEATYVADVSGDVSGNEDQSTAAGGGDVADPPADPQATDGPDSNAGKAKRA